MKMIFNAFRGKSLFYLFLLVLFFLTITLSQIQKPLVTDEVDFLTSAKGVEALGVPIAYHGETRTEEVWRWHPPLFLYVLAWAFKLGLPEGYVRVVPVFFVLLTIIMVYLIGRQIMNDNKRNLPLLSAFLYVISPLTIQSSLLIDIDNSILTFLLTLFVYAFLMTQHSGRRSIPLLGLLVGISLWAKIFTIPIALIAFFFYYALNGKLKQGVTHIVAITIIGGGIFLSTWWAYTYFTGMPFSGPFEYIYERVPNSTSFLDYLFVGIIYAGFKIFIFWMTPAFFFLVLLAALYRTRNYLQTRRASQLDLLLMYASSIFIVYALAGQSPWKFPKYIAPAMPVFSIIVADFVLKFKFGPRRRTVYLVGFLLPILFYTLFLSDPLIPPHSVSEAISISVLYSIPIFVVFFFLSAAFKMRRESILRIVALTMILSFLSTSLYLDYVQRGAEYSTIYNYGEEGLPLVASYATTHSEAGDIIISNIDVAYYANRSYIEVWDFIASDSIKQKEILELKNVRYLIFRDYELKRCKCVDLNLKLIANFGNFYIYQP